MMALRTIQHVAGREEGLTNRPQDKPRLKDVLQYTCLVLLKAAKVMRNKKSLRNCGRPEEVRDT